MAVDSAVALAIREIKKWKPVPHSLKLHCLDGSIAPLAVPTHRQKWAQIGKLIDNFEWFKVQGFDDEGGLLGTFDNPEMEAGEVEDISGPDSKVTREVVAMVKVMLQAQDVVLSRQERGMKQVMDAMMALLTAVTARQVEMEERHTKLERKHAENLQVMQELAEEIVKDPEEGPSMSDKVLEAVGPAIIKQLMAKAKVAAAAPTNGGDAG